LRAEDLSEVGFDPGMLGCGVVMCKVGQDPNGHDGALEFEEGNF
jgi:hypothetical protein